MGESCHSMGLLGNESESGQMPNMVSQLWDNSGIKQEYIICCNVEHKNDDGKTKQCEPLTPN